MFVKALLRKARRDITTCHQNKFKTAALPTENQLVTFLQTIELNFFSNTEKVVSIRTKAVDGSALLLFCLPPSSVIADDFIEKLSKYLPQTTCAVTLYWPSRIEGTEEYIDFRLTFIRGEKEIKVKVNSTYPFSHKGLEQSLNALKERLEEALLPEYILINETSKEQQEAHGDSLYWINLSLILAVTDEAEIYYQAYQKYLLRSSKEIVTLIKRIATDALSLAPYVSTPLFYAEQSITILNMTVLQERIANRVSSEFLVPIWAEKIPLRNLLRLSAIAFLFYEGNYIALSYIPIAYGLQSLARGVSSRVSHAALHTSLSFCSHLLIVGAHRGYSLYCTLPSAPLQRAIAAPRYLLDWSQSMSDQALNLFMRIPCMMLITFLLNLVLRNPDTDDQAGLLSISILIVQLLLLLVQYHKPDIAQLIKFSGWASRQNAEEKILNLFQQKCNDQRKFTIQSSIFSRVGQQALKNNQMLELEAEEVMGATQAMTDCQLSISTKNETCNYYQMRCQSRLFPAFNQSRTANVVAKQAIQVDPMNDEFELCEKGLFIK